MMRMDERLLTVREELEAGSVSPHSLVLLFNTSSEADHAGDLTTLEQTLDLARAIAEAAGETLQAEAERLAAICEESLANVRHRQVGATTKPADRVITCPECGNELPPNALRCRRCGHLFI
jgi:hypothetical protein